jgi:DNA-binding response OmpR family regulator
MTAAKTILVVDDEADIRQSVGRILRNKGFEVWLAEDGEQALNVLRSWEDFDLVILDVMMPKLDGFEVLKNLRKNLRSNIPVIMLTARSTEMDVADGYVKGADFYLTKPFDLQLLLDSVDYLIGDSAIIAMEKTDAPAERDSGIEERNSPWKS